MKEVRCPRCQKYWYTDKETGGTVRLCVDCAHELRQARYEPVLDKPFLFTVLGLVAAVVLLSSLAAAWPKISGVPLALFAGVLGLPGAVGLFRAVNGKHVGDADGGRIRWCLLFIGAGTACLLSLFSFVLRYGPK
jgi:hypothetical protein